MVMTRLSIGNPAETAAFQQAAVSLPRKTAKNGAIHQGSSVARAQAALH
jgi:hypothetical protein